jgi:hypothetical protein
MELRELIPPLSVVLGVILFLYGANYYDPVVGWTGVGLFVVGILAYLFLSISRPRTRSVQG